MKTKETNTNDMTKISEAELLKLVATKLDGKVLFPEKIEEAKKFIANISSSVI